MPLIPPKVEKSYTIVPKGTHIARCIGLVDIGTVETEWPIGSGTKKYIPKIRLSFELPEELNVFKEGDDPKPFVISEEYSLSMGSKAKLRPIVEGIIGATLTEKEAEVFDVEQLVGMTCLITVTHNPSKKDSSKIYANLAGTAPLMKGMKVKKPFNDYKVLTYGKWDEEYFQTLPDFIKDKMKSTPEYKALHDILKTNAEGIAYPKGDDSAEIPF